MKDLARKRPYVQPSPSLCVSLTISEAVAYVTSNPSAGDASLVLEEATVENNKEQHRLTAVEGRGGSMQGSGVDVYLRRNRISRSSREGPRMKEMKDEIQPGYHCE